MLAPKFNDLLVVLYLLVTNGTHVLLLIFNVLMLNFAGAHDIKGCILILGFVKSSSLLLKPVFSCGFPNSAYLLNFICLSIAPRR
jgi:hypothetical protein